MSRPYFSIAIPCKNRPDRMANAIRSVLEQTFTDLEVVVCDNSDASEVSKTRAAFDRFSDARLRYVRTDGRLSMPDNWERALADVRGEYVGILTDRSVYRRNALAIAHAEIERTGAQVLHWLCDHYGRDAAGREYRRRAVSHQRREFTSRELLNYFLNGHPKFAAKMLPKLLSAVCHRSILDRARSSSLGRICPPVCPDYTSGFLMLGHSEKVLLIEDSLFVSCGLGNGSAFRRRGPLADRFRQDLGMDWKDLVDRMPSEACFTHALVLNDFMRVKEALPDVFASYAIDRTQYYLGCLADYIKSARGGADRTEDLDALMAGLDRETEAVQGAVRSKHLFLQSVLTLPLAEASAEGKEPDDEPSDAAQTFDNVFEAMAWAETQQPMADEEFSSMPSLDLLNRWTVSERVGGVSP